MAPKTKGPQKDPLGITYGEEKSLEKIDFKLLFHGPLREKNVLLPGFLLFQAKTCARSPKKRNMAGNCMRQLFIAVSSKHDER